MITLLDTENANVDMGVVLAVVLTHTPSATNHVLCQAYIQLGDGTDDLCGTGGNYEYEIVVGSSSLQPQPKVIAFSTATEAAFWTEPFPVPANKQVLLLVKSPNLADSDVDVTAYLFDVSPLATGSIAATTFAAGAIDAAAIAANAIGASELATDAVAEIADAVWDEALSGHTTAGTAGKYLGDLGGGVGANTFTYTLTDGTDPISNVDISVSTDNPPTAFIAAGYTNASGVFTFSHNLAAGTTIYIWRVHPGYSFADPDSETTV